MSAIELAKETLGKSWLKRDETDFNSASVAVTENALHASGLFESRTHLLDISSEHAALALAINRKDPHVTKIISVVQGKFTPNPIVLKVLADHYRRTGTDMRYEVYDPLGKLIFEQASAHETYYKPEIEVLEKIKSWNPRENFTEYTLTEPLEPQLKRAALLGMQTHFSSTSKTTYGAAVRAGNKIYFGGVHSSFDKRLNLHAEMVAAISAISDVNRKITDVAIMSNKFTDEVAHMCGCCRQFFSEIQEKNKTPITVHAFSYNGKESEKFSLSEYLPAKWYSGKKLEDRK